MLNQFKHFRIKYIVNVHSTVFGLEKILRLDCHMMQRQVNKLDKSVSIVMTF